MVPNLDRVHDPDADNRRPIRMVNRDISDRVALFNGNLVTLGVDVIVNSRNRDLGIAHGVCFAIHTAAGPQLLAECSAQAPCKEGDAVMT